MARNGTLYENLEKNIFSTLALDGQNRHYFGIFSLKDDFGQNILFSGQSEYNENQTACPNYHFGIWVASVSLPKRIFKSPSTFLKIHICDNFHVLGTIFIIPQDSALLEQILWHIQETFDNTN